MDQARAIEILKESKALYHPTRGIYYKTNEVIEALAALNIKYVTPVEGQVGVIGFDYVDLVHMLGLKVNTLPDPAIKVYAIKMAPGAIIPSKARGSDVGYDLTIIEKVKELSHGGVMYDTGIQMRVPWGHYLEILPRSSLSKTGWMLANSVGVIDPSYTGNLLVAVTRVNPDAPPLPLPFRGFQLVVRRQFEMDICEMNAEDDTTVTARGAGGFGSTGGAVY